MCNRIMMQWSSLHYLITLADLFNSALSYILPICFWLHARSPPHPLGHDKLSPPEVSFCCLATAKNKNIYINC